VIERRRSARWLVALVATLAVILGISNSALARTTSTDAGSFTYDVPTLARVDVRASGGVDSGSAQFTGMREGSASPPAEALGSSTIQPAPVVATNTGLDATTARLQGHVDAAVADYESGAIGMSPNQARAAAVNPNLEPAYRGSVIDQATKTRIVADPGLDVSVTPNFQFGPDVYNTSGNWWDMTTPGQWQAHVDKYTPGFGTGTILRT
jgi:hypothetical protein